VIAAGGPDHGAGAPCSAAWARPAGHRDALLSRRGTGAAASLPRGRRSGRGPGLRARGGARRVPGDPRPRPSRLPDPTQTPSSASRASRRSGARFVGRGKRWRVLGPRERGPPAIGRSHAPRNRRSPSPPLPQAEEARRREAEAARKQEAARRAVPPAGGGAVASRGPAGGGGGGGGGYRDSGRDAARGACRFAWERRASRLLSRPCCPQHAHPHAWTPASHPDPTALLTHRTQPSRGPRLAAGAAGAAAARRPPAALRLPTTRGGGARPALAPTTRPASGLRSLPPHACGEQRASLPRRLQSFPRASVSNQPTPF
jgi:hypothetical protein